MDDQYVQIISELIRCHGLGLATNPRDCEQALRDACPHPATEVHVLLSVVREGIVAEMLHHSTLPEALRAARWLRRLNEQRAVEDEPAAWGVAAWANALELPPWPVVLRGAYLVQSLDDYPKHVLTELIIHPAHGGLVLLGNPGRCESLLRDLCPSFPREITVLVGALEQQIVPAFDSVFAPHTTSTFAQSCTKLLATSPETGFWTAHAWMAALEVLADVAMNALNECLRQNDLLVMEQVIAAYGTLIVHHPGRTPQVTHAVRRARRRVAAKEAALRAAFFIGDDAAIIDCYQADEALFAELGDLTPAEHDRLDLARRRLDVVEDMRQTLAGGDDMAITQLYTQHESLLLYCRDLAADERQRIRIAREQLLRHNMEQAIVAGVPEDIVLAGELALMGGCVLSAETALALSNARLEVKKAREALSELTCPSNDPERTLRQQILLEPLRRALAANDEAEIAVYYNADYFSESTMLTPDEHARCIAAVGKAQYLEVSRGEQIRTGTGISETALGFDSSVQSRRIIRATRRRHLAEALLAALATGDQESIAQTYGDAISAHVRLPETLDWRTLLDAVELAALKAQFYQLATSSESSSAELARVSWPLLFSSGASLTPEEFQRIVSAAISAGAILPTELSFSVEWPSNRP
ncbi:hypothetical protein [Herpetosiphon giganteus]|uniref:hypothetical protein n=1 Tax=Herpetosiphon giganteus TaxID=2029754 RepID=UPI00195760CC|nr:hypothetical protein [Herpetosiphon giganteus]MBM7846535.1 hypothetical protein [Herpetosiphon giganteus]